MMKQGARRVLVRKNITEACTVDKKPFAPFYKAVLKITGTPRAVASAKPVAPPSSSAFGCDRYCCQTREDIVRFLINCLGALAPTPLITTLGTVNRGYAHVEASSPAIQASWRVPSEPRAVAVVRMNRDGSHKVLADVSAHRLWLRDYMAAADAMVKLSSLSFAAGVDGHGMGSPDDEDVDSAGVAATSLRLSSGRDGFEVNLVDQMMMASHGWNAALRCRGTNSLAAVMAQMLSYRATHIWVTDGEDDVLVGVVGKLVTWRSSMRSPGVLLLPQLE